MGIETKIPKFKFKAKRNQRGLAEKKENRQREEDDKLLVFFFSNGVMTQKITPTLIKSKT